MQLTRPFLSARVAPWITSLLLSGLMTSFVSALTILSATGLSSASAAVWMNTWFTSWLVAFPALTVLAPVVRGFVGRITCDLVSVTHIRTVSGRVHGAQASYVTGASHRIES